MSCRRGGALLALLLLLSSGCATRPQSLGYPQRVVDEPLLIPHDVHESRVGGMITLGIEDDLLGYYGPGFGVGTRRGRGDRWETYGPLVLPIPLGVGLRVHGEGSDATALQWANLVRLDFYESGPDEKLRSTWTWIPIFGVEHRRKLGQSRRLDLRSGGGLALIDAVDPDADQQDERSWIYETQLELTHQWSDDFALGHGLALIASGGNVPLHLSNDRDSAWDPRYRGWHYELSLGPSWRLRRNWTFDGRIGLANDRLDPKLLRLDVGGFVRRVW